MAVNLVDLAKGLLTSDVVRSLAGQLGESPEQVAKAAEAGIPALLAGLLQTVSSAEGASRVGDLLKQDPPELADAGGLDGILGNLTAVLGGASAEKLISYGKVLLNAVFGGKLSQVIDVIQKSTGINASSVASLLATLAPLVLGLLKRQVHTEDFSAPGLVELLLSQKDLIAKLAPPGLASALGVRSLGDLGSMGHSLQSAAASAAAGSSSAAWLPWAAAAAVLVVCALGFYFFTPKAGPVQEVGAAANPALIAKQLPVAAAKAAANLAAPTKDTAKSLTSDGMPLVETAGKMVTLSLPGDAKLEVPDNSYIQLLVAYLAKPAGNGHQSFVANDLTFKDSTADLSADATATIGKLAAVLKAYGSAKLTIEAHTDNSGDAALNKKQSQERATAIKDALVKAGIPADRVTAVGTGPDQPIASNDTEDGRAKNRRIELKIAAN